MLVSCSPGQPGPFLSPVSLALRGDSIITRILENANRELRPWDVMCSVKRCLPGQAAVRVTDDVCIVLACRRGKINS